MATAAISLLGALAMPTARSLAGLAAIHLAVLGLAALAGGGFVAARAEPASATEAWLGALAHAWLGTAAVTALGYRMKDHALRSRQTSISTQRLPAVAEARRLLGFLLVASWLTLAIASAAAGAKALWSSAAATFPGSAALGSLGILGALSVLLLIDAVRGSSARQRARAALAAYALFIVTRVGL